MNTETLISPNDALAVVNTTMFQMQNALRGPITSIADIFPLKEGSQAGFEKELADFPPDMTFNRLLHQAVTEPGLARDFCGKAAIKYWMFEEVNPFAVLLPLYQQMFGTK